MRYLKIFLLSLMMLTITPASLVLTSGPATAQNNERWEYIGNTTAVNPYVYNDNISGRLYVKVVVNRLMYKFEETTYSTNNTTYSVIEDDSERGYNAVINVKGQKYYLKVPGW